MLLWPEVTEDYPLLSFISLEDAMESLAFPDFLYRLHFSAKKHAT